VRVDRQLWGEVDHYITEQFVGEDDALVVARDASRSAGLPDISVTPAQGKFLFLLARLLGARSILELGTLGAYSTIWLARSLPPDGQLITLEANPAHAEVAQANLRRAKVDDRVELRLGEALDTLPALAAQGMGPFDLVFIDADKPNIPSYFEWAIRLSRRGAAIVVDNVIRDGAVIDPANRDPNVEGVRRFNELLGRESRVSATTLQTVGAKGYDGFTLALVEGS
jgi:predicted O-methyltransferase YrrM